MYCLDVFKKSVYQQHVHVLLKVQTGTRSVNIDFVAFRKQQQTLHNVYKILVRKKCTLEYSPVKLKKEQFLLLIQFNIKVM